LSRDRLLLIEVFLEADEDLADLVRAAEVGDGVGDGVVVFEAQQRSQFLLVELADTHADVMR
jgi:hypothetical protein